MNTSQTSQSETQLAHPELLGPGANLDAPPPVGSGSLLKVNDGNELFHLEFANFHAGYVGQYIQLADAKAAATFAVAAGLLGYFLDNGAFEIIRRPAFEARFIIATITAITLVISGALAFVVVAPRLRRSSQDGFVFWGAVAQISTADDFVARVTSATSAGMVQARLAHCYDLSRVCVRKYAVLRFSMLIGGLGVAAAMVLILLT